MKRLGETYVVSVGRGDDGEDFCVAEFDREGYEIPTYLTRAEMLQLIRELTDLVNSPPTGGQDV